MTGIDQRTADLEACVAALEDDRRREWDEMTGKSTLHDDRRFVLGQHEPSSPGDANATATPTKPFYPPYKELIAGLRAQLSATRTVEVQALEQVRVERVTTANARRHAFDMEAARNVAKQQRDHAERERNEAREDAIALRAWVMEEKRGRERAIEEINHLRRSCSYAPPHEHGTRGKQ